MNLTKALHDPFKKYGPTGTLAAPVLALGPTGSGAFDQLGKSDYHGVAVAWEPGVIWRENGDFAVTVQGDVVEGLQGPTVSAEVWPELQKLKARLPLGYDIQIAGAVAESGKGQSSIAAGIPVMLFIMFTLLMLQLQSVSRARSWWC